MQRNDLTCESNANAILRIVLSQKSTYKIHVEKTQNKQLCKMQKHDKLMSNAIQLGFILLVVYWQVKVTSVSPRTLSTFASISSDWETVRWFFQSPTCPKEIAVSFGKLSSLSYAVYLFKCVTSSVIFSNGLEYLATYFSKHRNEIHFRKHEPCLVVKRCFKTISVHCLAILPSFTNLSETF